FGPDGKLYLAIGSSCNVCNESDNRRAAISVYDPDGKNGRLFATGLRNAVGFTCQPGPNQTGATVNGRDSIQGDRPPDDPRTVKTGYKVVRVPLVNGVPGKAEDFAWGWLPGDPNNPGPNWGRPVGVTVGSDGALYVTDDQKGRVYRIAATG